MNALLSESLVDLRRHGAAACRYVALSLLVTVVYRIAAYWLDGSALSETALSTAPLARMALALYVACASSAVQAVCFAALGAAIARPMWKWRGPRDGLARFFMPWLIINLFLVTLADIHLYIVRLEQQDLAALLELPLLAAHTAALPLGAVIMYWGVLHWPDLPAMAVPLTRFYQLTLLPLGLGLLQYILLGVRAQFLEATSLWALALYTATDIPVLLLDVLIFTQVWRICILNSTTPPDADESSLDF